MCLQSAHSDCACTWFEHHVLPNPNLAAEQRTRNHCSEALLHKHAVNRQTHGTRRFRLFDTRRDFAELSSNLRETQSAARTRSQQRLLCAVQECTFQETADLCLDIHQMIRAYQIGFADDRESI